MNVYACNDGYLYHNNNFILEYVCVDKSNTLNYLNMDHRYYCLMTLLLLYIVMSILRDCIVSPFFGHTTCAPWKTVII